jgi:TPR repeat protein
MCANGRGVPQDYAEAVKWFRKAADQGMARAQSDLGFMYADGQGVPQDFAEAVKWFRKAADQRYARGQANLGMMYSNGQGVPHDNVLAHMWLDLAAANFPASDPADRDKAVKDRDFLTGTMTPSQIAKAQALAAARKPTTGQ